LGGVEISQVTLQGLADVPDDARAYVKKKKRKRKKKIITI
jgi:hypothetical protein